MPVLADEDCAAPCAGYAVSLELASERTKLSGSGEGGSINVFPTIDTALFYQPADHLRLNLSVATETVTDAEGGTNQIFADVGSYVENISARIGDDDTYLRLGKFEASFGLATVALEGLHATDLVGDYDLDERLGAEAVIGFDGWLGSNRLVASAFTIDRSVLSGSLFTSRGRTRLDDGGAGNRKGVASLAIILDGCREAEITDCYAEGDFGYRIGFLHQRSGQATQEQADEGIRPRNETGVLAAATMATEIDDATLRLLGELTYFKHFDGEPDDALMATFGAEFESGPFTLMASYSLQKFLAHGAPDATVHLADITLRYDFGEGETGLTESTALSAGYSVSKDAEGETRHIIGVTLSVELEGATGAQ